MGCREEASLAYQNVVAEIESLPDGPEIGALFDFDGTIISGYSAVAFFQEQVKRGHMSPRDVVELMSVMASFGIGILGFPARSIPRRARSSKPTSARATRSRSFRQRRPTRSPLRHAASISSTYCVRTCKSKTASLRAPSCDRSVSAMARSLPQSHWPSRMVSILQRAFFIRTARMTSNFSSASATHDR